MKHPRLRVFTRKSAPYLTLLPVGFSMPCRLRFTRWALTPPFHPYSVMKISYTERSVFCGTVLYAALSRAIPRCSSGNRAPWSPDFPRKNFLNIPPWPAALPLICSLQSAAILQNLCPWQKGQKALFLS